MASPPKAGNRTVLLPALVLRVLKACKKANHPRWMFPPRQGGLSAGPSRRPEAAPDGAGVGGVQPAALRSASYLRHYSPAERRACEDRVQHAGPLRHRLHPPHLSPHCEAEAGRGCSNHGRLYGASHVKRNGKERESAPGRKFSCSFPSKPYLSGGGEAGHPFFPHKKYKSAKKTPKPQIFFVFCGKLGGGSNAEPHPYQ